MKDFIYAIRTNENGARTKLLVAGGITLATVGLGLYLTKKNSVPVVPVTPVVEIIVPDSLVENLVEEVTHAAAA